MISPIPQWQHCMVQSDCIRFLVSLYYAYGCALLKKGSYEVGREDGILVGELVQLDLRLREGY